MDLRSSINAAVRQVNWMELVQQALARRDQEIVMNDDEPEYIGTIEERMDDDLEE